MKKINIHGSCVTRDLFEYADNNVQVNEYIGRNSIFSACFEPLVPFCNDYDTSHQNHNWEKRMLQIDISKQVFEILKSNTGDFLVIDLIDTLFNLIKIESCDSQNVSCITYSQVLKRSALIDILAPKEKRSVIDISRFGDDLADYCIHYYCKAILKLYTPNQIILHEAFPVTSYRSMDDVKDFDQERMKSIKKKQVQCALYYSLLEKYMPGCHIIKMPEGVLADEAHRWGLASTHYEANYYKVTMELLDNIINEQKRFEKK